MRKGDDGEKKGGKKMMMKIVATNVVASRPPERRPTATPTAHANKPELKLRSYGYNLNFNVFLFGKKSEGTSLI